MNALLVDHDGHILGGWNVKPDELVRVKGRYWSMFGAYAGSGEAVSVIPPYRHSGFGFLVTAIEVTKISDSKGVKLPMTVVETGTAIAPTTR